MPRREDEELVRKHIWLYKSDWQWIEEIYGQNLGTSKATRQILRNYRKQVQAKALENAAHPAPLNNSELEPSDAKPAERSEPAGAK